MMSVVLYWERNGRRKHLFSVSFSEFERFMGLIKSINFDKPGKLVIDVTEDTGIYRKHMESGLELDTLFNVITNYKEDMDEYFDYERFFPKDSVSSTANADDDLML